MTHTMLSAPEATAHQDNAEHASLQHHFDSLRQRVAFDLVAIVSCMPRGGLQVLQPQRLPEAFVKGYAREFSAEDRLTWRAIRQQQAFNDVQADLSDDRYRTAFLAPLGLAHAAAAPLEAPLFQGYPGAVHVYRSAERGEFTQIELYELAQFASRLDRVAAEERSRRTGPLDKDVSVRNVTARQFIFDGRGEQLSTPSDLNELDSHLVEQIRQHVQALLADPKKADAARVSLPDAHGDLWNFRVSLQQNYPALAEGPVVFFNLVPDSVEWAALRPADFAADAELARMVPAMRFMHDEFARVPTLQEIARTVHLSPFHFHRRFTELFGLTPKHFLLDCQIAAAKRQLVAQDKELSAIAAGCGFAHQSHFTSRFKQATGLTPTRWRRMALEAQPTA